MKDRGGPPGRWLEAEKLRREGLTLLRTSSTVPPRCRTGRAVPDVATSSVRGSRLAGSFDSSTGTIVISCSGTLYHRVKETDEKLRRCLHNRVH